MPDHIPQLDGVTWTCPACSWRAVLTTDGRIIITRAGDAGHDHIGQAIAQRAAMRAEAAAIVERTMRCLQARYEMREVLPSGATLSLGLLKRLYKFVIAEHLQ